MSPGGRLGASSPRRWQRLVATADFERALEQTSVARTSHFAIHHLAGPAPPKLCTDARQTGSQAVDKALLAVDGGCWLGLVVPKRHAKRAVTRSLVKRQIRAAAERATTAVADGVWVVRLRAPFDRAAFPSARSEALKRVVRIELEALFASASALVRRAS